MGIAIQKENEGYSNLLLLPIFVFENSRNITIQGIYNSIKIQKFIVVRILLLSFSNRHQDFSGYSITS